MVVWQRASLLVGLIALGIGEVAWNIHSARHHVEQMRQTGAAMAAAQRQRAIEALPPARHFTRAQTYGFLAAAKRAEAVVDPLARCLAYPDPPGSHWARDTVEAYCHYYLQPLLGFDEARTLIEHGKSAQLDRRLAEALRAQQTRPEARGLLDRIYRKAFDNGAIEVRFALDAWKRDSPDSAFAWAASGTAYVAMASQSRGTDYIAKTSADDLRAMDNLAAEAADDLRRAIALNPKMTPAYTALIQAAGMAGSRAEVNEAIRTALLAVPDDYSIYSTAMWTQEPKWGGSLADMDALAAQAQTHAATNPLLRILLSERPYYQVKQADLTMQEELARYPAVLARFVSVPNLTRVGKLADEVADRTSAAIYPSELLRFTPDDDAMRTLRAYALMDYDEMAWALADLGAILARSPHDVHAREARAYAYQLQDDHAHAEGDLRALVADDPGNIDFQFQLGMLYVGSQQWGKSAAIADTLVRDQPQSPAGWLLRANVQQLQPRAGLADTAREFEERFGKDPSMAKTLVELRAAVALRAHTGLDAVPPGSTPQRR